MSSIVDSHFPSYETLIHANPLGEYPDASEHGEATSYFATLSQSDRELVHWYAGDQGLPPHAMAEEYVFSFIANYANVDPCRRHKRGVKSATEEVQRVRRYVTLFRDSPNYFFPLARECLTTVFDDSTGEEMPVVQLAWTNLSTCAEEFTALRNYAGPQLEIIEDAERFLRDPASSIWFDQAFMLDQLPHASSSVIDEL